jgi:CrcB protein
VATSCSAGDADVPPQHATSAEFAVTAVITAWTITAVHGARAAGTASDPPDQSEMLLCALNIARPASFALPFCAPSTRVRRRSHGRDGDGMTMYVWIAIGGAIGSMARYWCSGMVARLIGETFPFGTLFVNIVGSFVIGFVATVTGPDGRMFVGAAGRQFVMTGILGGYTTFSSFSLQTLNLINDGEWLAAGANVTVSVAMCLLSVWAGHALAVAVNAMKWV